jgi:hypothetical protein
VDWTAFDAWRSSHGTAPRDDAHRDAAIEIVAALGDDVAPKHLDALLARREAEGAPIAELAVWKRAGEDLVRFHRLARSVPPPQAIEAAAVEEAAPASPYAGISAEAAAALPVAGLLRAADPDRSPSIEWLRKYGWIFDVVSVVFGFGFVYLRFHLASPYDVTLDPIVRAIGWVGGICITSGAASLLRRTDWLDWDALMPDHPLGRLWRQRQSYWRLHTISVIVGLVMLPFVLMARGSAAPAREPELPNLGAAMQEPWPTARPTGTFADRMGAIVDNPTGWQYERDVRLTAGSSPWQAAFFSSADHPAETLVIMTAPPILAADLQRTMTDRAVALSAILASELGVAAADVRCGPSTATPHVDVECRHRALPPARSFALVCQASPFVSACAAWSGTRSEREMLPTIAQVAASVRPRGI